MVGGNIAAWDRRRDLILDAEAVHAKFGVPPASIPDYLALVGDSADGYPGLPGWGAKSAASVLAAYGNIDNIPADSAAWQVPGLSATRAAKLAATLHAQHADALLFRTLATLRTDVPLPQTLADLEWRGAHPQLRELLAELGAETIAERVTRWQ
jgi:5'-3' exonuclease